MASSEWRDLWPESQHLAHVLAVARDARGSMPVFSHVSAAVLWGLPLFGVKSEHVHVTLGDVARHCASDVLRHEGALPEPDVAVVGGLRCTSLERTVYDLMRTLPPEAALVAADAALAQIGGGFREFDDDASRHWVERMRGRVNRSSARGVRQARRVVDLADGRAQLPLESVSRYRLHQLGFARPRLQVPVPAPGRGHFWLDMALDDVDAFVECDGKSKYLEEGLRRTRTLEEVLLEEKEREDWIRGTTGRRVLRWGHEHVRSPQALASRLRAFGIPC
jgi:hypothetical protein